MIIKEAEIQYSSGIPRVQKLCWYHRNTDTAMSSVQSVEIQDTLPIVSN